mmetsp:Transcript_40236/g.67081  ORF Transcript_40236/g.67081 Transcript_40236/m.67081 type:complete len:258 (-) Transcript_40236:79-852(-)
MKRFSVQEKQVPQASGSNQLVHLLGRRQLEVCIRECQVKAPSVRKAVDVRGVRHDLWKDLLQRVVHWGENHGVVLDPSGTALRDQNTPGIQLVHAFRVEFFRVQLVAGAPFQWVIKIHDDDVKFGLRLQKLFLCTINNQLQPAVVKSLGILWEDIATKPHYISINIHHDTLLHGVMLQNLSYGGAFPSASNVHTFRVGMHKHCRVDQTLVVDPFINIRTLHQTINNQALSKGDSVEDRNCLELACCLVQHPLHTIGQ